MLSRCLCREAINCRVPRSVWEGGVTRVEDLVVVELLEAGGPVLVNPQGHPSNTFLKQKVYRLWFSHKVLTGQNTVLKL